MPMPTAAIKPTHKAIQVYYDTLLGYAAHNAGHEGAVRTAFQRLLEDTSRTHGMTLVPEQSLKVKGKLIRPDGILYDDLKLRIGFWEAKDEADKLDDEIRKKIARGYPLNNTIFEDTRTAVLFQNGQEALRVGLDQRQNLADLLNQFYAHTEPNIESFHQAVAEFKDQIPNLARGLLGRITEAHAANPRFQKAFDGFFELCQTALNPNIRRDAVDTMLVQHLLTERLFRKVFGNSEFTRRNVIAAEIETVISALIGQSFNRDEFLKKLDRFYVAIEAAAVNLEDFGEKQRFLNNVYERFFQGYDVKAADTHGIVYTPQEIVDFMCASVEEVLKTEFGLTLGSPGVNILDPCTGTGNFIVNLMRRVPKKDLPRVYREQLFANEVMLLPYYIASQNIEHEYFELTGQYEPFEGLCFVDTLDLAEGQQKSLSFMSEANTARVERLKRTPITVIIGNPPYNVGQLNENDNNKNRKYSIIDKRVSQTYSKDSTATNKNALSDPYVKFFRWAVDRLGQRDGIVCFVSNNSFVDQIAFDGMRKNLSNEFTRIYHMHLEGNVRHNPTLSGTTYNVFGIQVGVGITVAIRSSRHQNKERLFFYRIEKNLRKFEKLDLINQYKHIYGRDIAWKPLAPDNRNTWIVPDNAEEFARFILIAYKQSSDADTTDLVTEYIFRLASLGFKTNRDDFIYDFNSKKLEKRVLTFIEDYNSEVDRFKRSDPNVSIDEFVRYDKIKWSETLKANLGRGRYAKYDSSQIRVATYRPFTKKFVFNDNLLVERRYQFPHFIPPCNSDEKNKIIALTDIGSEKPFMALISNEIIDLHVVGGGSSAQCFPFHTYDEDGTNRRENITDWALKQFQDHYADPTITKWDIFHYVYGVLHEPTYRTKFADNLKRELPRIPYMADFRAFAEAGRRLADLHLNYETVEPWPLDWVEAPGVPLSYRVEKMKLSKDKTSLAVNDTLTLAGIPPEVFSYRLGNRSALDWVIDQYRVTTTAADSPGGARVSDPNRADDPEYIVRLVGQVVRVSVETVAIVSGLPSS